MADANTDVKGKAPKDKSKGMMIIIIAMLAIIIAAIVGGVVLLLTQLNNEPTETVVIMYEPAAITEMDIRVVPISRPIATNLLQGPGGARHNVRLEVALGINDLDEEEADEMEDMIRAREDAILDRINSILRRTTRDDIEREGGSDMLAEEILMSLQDMFDTNMIVRVYFPAIVTQ
jgi:flagellar basal body-associated protein FliL